MSARRPRVAITGIGVVSPFGVGRECFWSAIAAGRSGTRAVTEFDTTHLANRVAAPVPDHALPDTPAPSADEPAGNGRADPRRYAKVSRIAVLAAREAFADAGLNGETADKFDREYMKQMVEDHEKAVKLFQRQAETL